MRRLQCEKAADDEVPTIQIDMSQFIRLVVSCRLVSAKCDA